MTIENKPFKDGYEDPRKALVRRWSKFLVNYGIVSGRMSIIMAGLVIATAGFGLELPETILEKVKLFTKGKPKEWIMSHIIIPCLTVA